MSYEALLRNPDPDKSGWVGAGARTGELTLEEQRGAVATGVAIVGAALLFAYLAASYRPTYPQLRPRRRA